MAQHTIDAPCIGDAGVDFDNPNTNYGTNLSYEINNHTASDTRVKKSAFLKFNIPSTVRRKNILSAIFSAYCIARDSGSPYLKVRSIDLNWDESTITYTSSTAMTNMIELVDDYDSSSFFTDSKWVNVQLISTRVQQNLEKIYDSGIEIFHWRDQYAGSANFASRESTYAPYLTIIYEDVPPEAPTPVDPVGAYRDKVNTIRFTWRYNSTVGGTQKKFDLQWSVDQTTWTTVSETTENNYYDMPGDTFPVGNIYWRVRTYNEYDEVGAYCDIQSFYSIGAPNAPTINTVPADTARPTITWAAFNQQVYQLQVFSGDSVVYDSSNIPGIYTRSHKISVWLPDGDYTVKLRIKNEYDLWSAWGEASFTITTAKPDKLTLDLQPSAHGIELNFSAPPEDGYALIYRSEYVKDDYICIGKTTAEAYRDNTVRSGTEYKYFVRAVSADETYRDSDIKFVKANFKHALIAPVSDISKIITFARSLNAPPKRVYNNQPGGAHVNYAGRKHPVWEPDEHISAAWSIGGYFLKTWAEAEAFTALCDSKETVLYRDARGRKIYGTLGNLSVSDELMGYIVSFTISQVDYNEELEV